MNPRVFFDFTADGEPIGRVIFELFADSVPKTAENFRALCTGEKGLSPKTQLPLYYKNSIIHRSIQDFMIQGGDFTKRSGMGGESIYGAPFEDEDLVRQVDSEALLVMANRGPNTNASQFFITLRPCPHLNGKHVVFGKVVRGYDDVVTKIAAVSTDEKDRPLRPVIIVNCGELERRKLPAKREPSAAALESADEERGRAHKRKKHRRQALSSRSASGSSPYSRSRSRSDSEDERKRNKRKHKHKSKLTSKSKRDSDQPAEPRKETEEEYDARLEREEKERLEVERQAEVARLREELLKKAERKDQGDGRINYKGRGRMKYVDPETASRRYDRL